MANCHKSFLNFNTVVSLSSEQKAELRKSRNAVRKKIRKRFKENHGGLSPKFHGQGSFMMNAIIEPLDGEFDVDDGIYFEVASEPTQSVNTFHRWIYDAVDGHTNQAPVDKQTCVRLIYAKHYHLDLPIYYIVKGQTPYLAHKGKGWIESDPREFIHWFNDQADEEGQFKRIVRYLKAWSDYRKGDLPSGMIFSILAANNICFDERDDVALHQTLVNIRCSLQANFACYRPTTPANEDLLADYSKTKKEYFLDRLSSFIQSAERALSDDTSPKDACKAWQKHLGKDRFSLVSDDESTSTALAESFTEYSRGDSTYEGIDCDDAEEFIENRFPVSIQYDLRIKCRVSQPGFMTRFLHEMLGEQLPLRKGRKLEFLIASNSVPKPFSVKWKVRNAGQEAIKRNMMRGQILDDFGGCKRSERSDFEGAHFVECYIVKGGVCVAKSKVDVPITPS